MAPVGEVQMGSDSVKTGSTSNGAVGDCGPPLTDFPISATASATKRNHRQRKAATNQDIVDRNARDMDFNWVNEDEIAIFAKALAEEPDAIGHSPVNERIRAVSDFAPIHERVRLPNGRVDVVREGVAWKWTRFPLLFIIGAIIVGEFVAYVILRQFVNVMEFVSRKSGQRARLVTALRSSTSYEEWERHALALDDYLGFASWKQIESNAYYDSQMIKRVLQALRELREKDDALGVKSILEIVLRSNFAGVESWHLYAGAYLGTKQLVQEYVDEVTRCVNFVRIAPSDIISTTEKARFFRHSAKNLGSTALCLSGGASFGYYHFGVVRALLDSNLLPRVMTGTSAGAIIAAFACTRTDDELKEMLIPELANKITACEESTLQWMKRAWTTGTRFDTIEWARKACFFTMGSTTFLEAYQRTGRILNVSVIPYDTHSPTKLLNYISAPNCVIYSAVLASAAVPGILQPVVLLEKKDGVLRPWEYQGKHRDGSLRVDIPLDSLHLLFNTSFSIVSQANPHVHLFHFGARGSIGRPVSHRSGRGWRGGFLLSAMEQLLKLELTKNFRIIRELELMPQFLGQDWSGLFLQRFEGTVTIYPKSRLADWPRILTDPDPEELARMMAVGQIVTWPKIKMIENRMKIEREIDLARAEIHSRLTTEGDAASSTSTRPAAILRRWSSSFAEDDFRLSSPVDQDRDHGGEAEEDQAAQDNDDDEEGLRDSRRSSLDRLNSSIFGPSGNGAISPLQQRRSEILSRLGVSLRSAAASAPPGSVFSAPYDDSDDTDEGGLVSNPFKRRYSLARRVRGKRDSVMGRLGVGESSDDAGEGDEVHSASDGEVNGGGSSAIRRRNGWSSR